METTRCDGARVVFTQNGFLTLDALKQLIEVDRLLIVVGDADTQGFDHILFIGATGQQDAFKGALFAGQFLQMLSLPIHKSAWCCVIFTCPK